MTSLHPRSCSQPRSVWNRHKTLSMAERATGNEGKASQARSHIISSATQAEPVTMRWLFMCLYVINMIIKPKIRVKSECQQKNKSFMTKAEKARPQQWDTEYICMLARTCILKLSGIYRNTTFIIVFGLKLFRVKDNVTYSNIRENSWNEECEIIIIK